MIAGLALVAGWSFAEGCLFFLVADVPISWIALRHGWRRALLAAMLAAPMAALGGLAMATWTAGDPQSARAALVALPAIDAALIDDALHRWQSGGYVAMAQAAFAGVPYKLYAHAQGTDPHGGAASFVTGSIAARLPRFVLMALAVATIGRWLRPRTTLRQRALLFAAGWATFYAWYFAAMQG